MRITDEELEYWGEVFVAHDYAKHMRFEQFIQNPEHHHNRIQFYRSQGIDPAAVPKLLPALSVMLRLWRGATGMLLNALNITVIVRRKP